MDHVTIEHRRTCSQNLFNDRPYIRCMDCLFSQKNKCNKCMKEVISRLHELNAKAVEHHRSILESAEKNRKLPKMTMRIEIKNAYQHYLEQCMKKRRQTQNTEDRRVSPLREVKFDNWANRTTHMLRRKHRNLAN